MISSDEDNTQEGGSTVDSTDATQEGDSTVDSTAATQEGDSTVDSTAATQEGGSAVDSTAATHEGGSTVDSTAATQEGGSTVDPTPDTRLKESPAIESTLSEATIATVTTHGRHSLDGSRRAEALTEGDDVFDVITDREVTVSQLEGVSDAM